MGNVVLLHDADRVPQPLLLLLSALGAQSMQSASRACQLRFRDLQGFIVAAWCFFEYFCQFGIILLLSTQFCTVPR